MLGRTPAGDAPAGVLPFRLGSADRRGSGLEAALPRAEPVQQEVAELDERVAGGQAGPLQQDPGLNGVDGDRHDLRGELAVERAEDTGPHALLDQLVDPARGSSGVDAVYTCRRL